MLPTDAVASCPSDGCPLKPFKFVKAPLGYTLALHGCRFCNFDHVVVMGSMAVGWNDLGSWTQLLTELGAGCEGRVVQPNEAVTAADGDVVIQRAGGRLVVSDGPQTIAGPSPSALLVGGASFRPRIDALVARVAAWEERQ